MGTGINVATMLDGGLLQLLTRAQLVYNPAITGYNPVITGLSGGKRLASGAALTNHLCALNPLTTGL